MTALRGWIGVATACALALACAPQADVRNVTVNEVATLRSVEPPPVVLDVRSEAEYRAGHIAGATHIPHTELAGRIGEILVPEAGVIVYCQRGPRARLAEQTLLEHGISGLMHLQDGFSAWEEAGLPVER